MKAAQLIFSTLALTLCLFGRLTLQKEAPLPTKISDFMATRAERYHHFLWHNIRDNWNSYDSDTQESLKSIGWAPPNPARIMDQFGQLIAIFDNDAGEDFLYMHRQMIETVNRMSDRLHDPYGHVKGWKTVPAPGDLDWPVAAPYPVDNDTNMTMIIGLAKSNEFYYDSIVPLEEALQDPEMLKTMTLNELGVYVEITVHNWMHMRFSNMSELGYRPVIAEAIPDIDKKWDNPSYNWLGETYSSHVNPIFWKLHGWVDDRIEDWRVANGLDSITWSGTWVGGPMSSISDLVMKTGDSHMDMDGMDQDPEAVGDTLQKAFDIVSKVAKVTKESRFSDDVKSDYKKRFKLE